MDWWKLFAILVATTSISITADGAKKKIRIHLPQKVKHIHHHKKIYITNHSASSQYAPAYLPSAEGAVAIPTNVALPAVANLVPFDSSEVYDELQGGLPGITPTASKLLPLYRARGYYGPHHSEWDDEDYEIAPLPEPIEHPHLPPVYPIPKVPPNLNYAPKRVKLVKIGEMPRKKAVRRLKPKSPSIRGRPRPELPPRDVDRPVSSFHEQFYSDLEGTGTIKRIKGPQRVEKIIDGDTEHIHTYSEEHIHKMVYDDRHKYPGTGGYEQISSMSAAALTARHPLMPFKGGHAIVAISPNTYAALTPIGSLGTPAHMEYASYNPRDATYDHIFHDHGEIPADVDITKDSLRIPPKVSYNSQGLRIGTSHAKNPKAKSYNKNSKPTKPTPANDFSYYESIYSPLMSKPLRPTPVSHADTSVEGNEDYRPIPSFKLRDKGKVKNSQTSYYGNGKFLDSQQKQANHFPTPFSLSSTAVHDFKQKTFGTSQASFLNYKDPFVNYKDSPSNLEYDTFASSSNIHETENKNDIPVANKGKKSVSMLNVKFGGEDRQMLIHHIDDPLTSGNDDIVPTAIGAADSNIEEQLQPTDSAISTAYTIRESSPAHHYYTTMAKKALQGFRQPEENSNQYIENSTAATQYAPTVATNTSSPEIINIHNRNSAGMDNESRDYIKRRTKSNSETTEHKQVYADYLPVDKERQTSQNNLKYGDKL